MSDTNTRDLELLLLGAVLTKSDEGNKLLKSIPVGYLSQEVGGLIEEVRNKKPQKLLKWLSERGAPLERGRDSLHAALHALLQEVKREHARQILATLNQSSRVGTLDDLLNDVETALVNLREMKDDLSGV